MGSYQWYLTEERKELIKAAKESPDKSTMDLSDILEAALREWLQKHGQGNPAFSLEKFQDPLFMAYPTMGEPVRPDISDDALEEYLRVNGARTAEAEHLAKARGWQKDGHIWVRP